MRGWGIVAKAVLVDSNLSVLAKAVYAYLAVHADRKRRAFPGQASIARHMGIHIQTARKGLRELEHAGYVKIRSRRSPDGCYTRNEYVLLDGIGPGAVQPTSVQTHANMIIDLPDAREIWKRIKGGSASDK